MKQTLAESQIQDNLKQFVSRGDLSGIQYAVVDTAGFRTNLEAGKSDLRSDRPVRANDTFMASSTTKVITALAILQLVERERIRLEDSASRYAEHPYGDSITIRHLLAQTSGIPNPLPLRWIHLVSEHAGFDENAAFQKTVKRHSRLLFTPGTRYAYSNISYWLLGRIVTSASAQSFQSYVQENIFSPLASEQISAGFSIDASHHATGYQKKLSPLGIVLYFMIDRRMIDSSEQGRFRFHPVYMNGPAYGGLICSASWLTRFLEDMLRPTPRLCSASTRDLLLTPQQTSDGRACGMTLGWRTGNLHGEPYFGKPGGGPGFQSNVRLYPGKGIGTAWMANETGINERKINAISDALDAHWL